MLVIAVAVAAGLVGLVRLIHDVYVALAARLLRRHLPRLLARLTASVLAAALAVGLVTGLLSQGLVRVSPDSAGGSVAQSGCGGRNQRAALVASGVTIAALAALNVADHLVRGGLWLAPLATLALLGFARWRGLSWQQLGLGRDRVRAGSVWAAGAIAVVALIYLAGALLPLTRPAFLDARYHFGVAGALISALVVIPVGTIMVEEVAFRSVLWGSGSKPSAPTSAWCATATWSSAGGR